MSVSYAIMAHPKREHFIPSLLDVLPDAPVVWDEKNDRWDTGRRSLLTHDPTAEQHCVVQDDAVLCAEFRAAVDLVVQRVPRNPVCLYVGRTRPRPTDVKRAVTAAKNKGTPWLCGRGPWWGVALIMPVMFIERVVRWCDKQTGLPNYDLRLAAYFRKAQIPCWYTVPCLVDHRAIDENPSLVPGRTADRHCWEFLGDRSPHDIDWDAGPVALR